MGTVIQLPEGKLLACVSAATHIEIDERRQQSGSLLCYTIFFVMLLLYVFPTVERGVWLVYFIVVGLVCL